MISGTYEDLLKKVYNSNNSLIYTNTAKELMNDEFINLMLVKNNSTFIKNSFKIPEPIEKFYLCKLPNNINVIKKFISDSVLDKINANDISGAIKELGGKNENETNIIELVSKELKRELFNKQAERDYISTLDIPLEQKNAKLKTIITEIENQEDWIDPAGGRHSFDEEDPARQYESKYGPKNKKKLFEQKWSQCSEDSQMAKIQVKNILNNAQQILDKIDQHLSKKVFIGE